jgi:phosphoglycolate phosphatase-like HAD superfamily hydrolase
MVGDSPYDLMSGKSAGTSTAAVAWGTFPREHLDAVPPDRWLPDPHAIRELAV